MATLYRCLIIATLLLGGACALRPVVEPHGNACLRHFQTMDQRIKTAGVGDHGAHRPPGFPWLRSTRFSASFAGQLKRESEWRAWLEQLRREDMAARSAELVNAGVQYPQRELARLESCGRQLNYALLVDAQARGKLQQAVAVPDDYSLLQRLFGAYPLALPFLKAGITDYQQSVLERFERPLPKLPVQGRLQLYAPPAAGPPVDMGAIPRDALGIPQPDRRQLHRLARQHAPAWWLDTVADYDRPGRPRLGQGGAVVDVDQPVVYFQPAYTRLGSQVLLQLVYLAWFDQRPPRYPLDPFAGRLDGVIWRVTLDVQGRPLFYDSIHACGCYHHIFAAQRLDPGTLAWDREPWLLPQARLPDPPLALRLQSGSHYLQRVVSTAVAGAATSAPTRSYRLQPYAQLLSLPDAGGGRRSLFARDGIVPGSERGERWWLWPSGVPSPGAMRQWGRHAIAFVGMRHFDDPFLAQRLTEASESGK